MLGEKINGVTFYGLLYWSTKLEVFYTMQFLNCNKRQELKSRQLASDCNV